jgi:hypothetical protein
MNAFSIRLCAEDETLIKDLDSIVESAASSAREDSERLGKRLAQVVKSQEAVEAKAAARQRIYEKQKSREIQKYSDYMAAKSRSEIARRKYLDKSSRVSQLADEQRNLSAEIHSKNSFLSNFDDLYDESSLSNRAFMLKSVDSFIDKRVPVNYVEDPISGVSILSWTTNTIKLKDGFGGFLDQVFGKFKVEIRYTYQANGFQGVTASFRQAGNNISFSSYSHPHIQTDGSPCLGNVQRMLLQHMKNKDIANVIVTTTEYLITYNHVDPYARLHKFGIANRWDHKLCACGKGLWIDKCGCESTGPVEDCGMSASECMRWHRNSHPGLSKGSCVLGEFVEFIDVAKAAVTQIQKLGVIDESTQQADG